MSKREVSVRSSPFEAESTTSDHVVGFTCECCRSTMPVDSTTYEDILANGCMVCGEGVGPSAFSRRTTA